VGRQVNRRSNDTRFSGTEHHEMLGGREMPQLYRGGNIGIMLQIKRSIEYRQGRAVFSLAVHVEMLPGSHPAKCNSFRNIGVLIQIPFGIKQAFQGHVCSPYQVLITYVGTAEWRLSRNRSKMLQRENYRNSNK